MHAENLIELQVIDEIIKEPLGGAHHDPATVYANVKKYVLEQWNGLKAIPIDTLVEERYQKFRHLGQAGGEAGYETGGQTEE
jgi:acetyl-CoA carboxylase carboxyl transferase subunit alpha